jgi:hypothetical protein
MGDLSTTRQLTRTILSRASVDAIWAVLMDSSKLPLWAPPVEGVDSCDHSGEGVGSVRVCRASLAGRQGTIVERVLDMQEKSHITYVVDEDSSGMSKMFSGYGFRLSLASLDAGAQISVESFYTPRNPLYALMNWLVMKRQFGKVLDGLLLGLSKFAEKA